MIDYFLPETIQLHQFHPYISMPEDDRDSIFGCIDNDILAVLNVDLGDPPIEAIIQLFCRKIYFSKSFYKRKKC